MFSHNNSQIQYTTNNLYPDHSSDFPTQSPFPFQESTTTTTAFSSSPLTIPGDHDCRHSALAPDFGSYGGSPTSYAGGAAYSAARFIHRSISSHSLPKNSQVYSMMHAPSSSPPITGGSVRKVMSAGDLQRVNLAHQNQRSSSNLSANESSIIESMSRASPYSPEEKKERIQRYRSKRNLRNFNKKIKYECRKTLADSRPRIRGRFARNGEIEKTVHSRWEDDDYEDDHDNWINYLGPFSTTDFDDQAWMS